MDGLLHRVTKAGAEVDLKMDWYESQIRRLIEEIKAVYQDVYFAVFSDHGMTTLAGVVDENMRSERWVSSLERIMRRYMTPQWRVFGS